MGKTEKDRRHTVATWRIMSQLLESENTDDALQGALETIVGQLGSEAGAIWFLDRKSNMLIPVCCMGPIDISDMTVENGIGIEGVVTQKGESIMIADVDRDPRIEDSVYDDRGHKAQTLICVPLKALGEAMGCILIINRLDGKLYDKEDLELCEKMAALAAMTIEEKGINLPQFDKKRAIISLRNITKEYRSGDDILKVLQGINLDIYENEFMVVLGESGCGKSTMMNIIGGMDHPTGGTLTIEGRDFSKPTPKDLTDYRREYLGFIFQSYNLMPNLTARGNVRFIAEICNNPMDVDEAISLVGLSARADNYPSQMSGGQQQRVSIARALVKNPKLILADEPTAALDFQTGQEVLRVIEKVVKEKGTTVVMITHNVEIAKMADRVVKLRSGRVSSIKRNLNPLTADEISW